MKRLFLFSLLAGAVVLASCGAGGSGDGEAVDSAAANLPEVLKTRTTEVDLSEYYYPFALIIPDSSRGYLEVEETGYGETIVRVGSIYNLIVAEGGDIEAKKAEVKDELMFTNTILEEGDDYFIYKSEIEGSPLDPEYHFYAVKDVNGTTYEFRDNKDEGPFAETIIRFMKESVDHLSPNQPAS